MAAADASTGAVTGIVVDEGSGRFLEGAEVYIEGTGHRTSAQRGGRFVLTGLPPGSHELSVAYPGMETRTQSVTVSAGDSAEAGEIRLSSDVVMLGEFTVQTSREGMAQAIALQKVSVQAKLVAAGDQFGVISEGNVGEYLKFLPGVSIDYNVNDARGVSLRGLSTAFTVVTVDGTPMAGASSTDDTRRFEFEQIAMNNVETTELFKTVTPDIPANATGGYVNFVTKSAFDTENISQLAYDVAFTGPSSEWRFGKKGGTWGRDENHVVRPNLELNYGRRVNQSLGFNLNYRLSEIYHDSPRTELTWVNDANNDANGTTVTNPRLQQYNIRDEQKLTHREAFAGKVDYFIAERTKLTFSGQWNWYDLLFQQRGPNFVLGTGSTGSGEIFTSGSSGASVQNGVLQRNKYGTTWHFNGTLVHETDRGRATLTAYNSKADGKYRDVQKGFISATATRTPSATSYSSFTVNGLRLGQLPSIAVLNGVTPVSLDFFRELENYSFAATGGNFQSRPWTSEDRKDGINADYSHDLADSGIPLKLQIGVALDNIERTIDRPTIQGAGAPTITGTNLGVFADPDYTDDVALGFGRLEAIDAYAIYQAYGSFLTNQTVADFRRIDEENLAGFVRADYQLSPDLLLVGGVRWEEREIEAMARTGSPARQRPATFDLEYDNLYPSLSARYAPARNRNLVIRGGFSRTVGHPDYRDMLPSFIARSTPTSTDGSITIPDPDLKPYFSRNYDLSVDYYLPNSGVVGVYLFYKDVKNYITGRSLTAPELAQTALDYDQDPAEFQSGTLQVNGGDSTLKGFELSYAQNLSFLPSPLDGLSVQANYSHVDIDSSDIDTFYSQSRAVSPNTFNLVLGYRLGRFALTTTTNWVDDSLYGGFVNTDFFVGTANPANPDLDTRLTRNKYARVQTDVKLEYKFSDHVSVYLLARNITNEPREEFFRGYLPENRDVVLPQRYFEFGEPMLTIGARGRF